MGCFLFSKDVQRCLLNDVMFNDVMLLLFKGCLKMCDVKDVQRFDAVNVQMMLNVHCSKMCDIKYVQ